MPIETSVKGRVRFTRRWTILGTRHHVLHLIRVFLLDGVDDRFRIGRSYLLKRVLRILKIGHWKVLLF